MLYNRLYLLAFLLFQLPGNIGYDWTQTENGKFPTGKSSSQLQSFSDSGHDAEGRAEAAAAHLFYCLPRTFWLPIELRMPIHFQFHADDTILNLEGL